MKKIGVFYNFGSNKTAKVAEKIIEKFGKDNVDVIDVSQAWEKEFSGYDKLIFGVPTVYDGELPTYWDELVPMLEDMNFKGKKVAIFGNGNQKDYSENFGDAVGAMAEIMNLAGAQLVGYTSSKEYSFESSKALLEDGRFCGLILDFENQAKLNQPRINQWVDQLNSEF